MERHILSLADWFNKHYSIGYHEFVVALENRKLGLPIEHEITSSPDSPQKIKLKKKKKRKLRKTQKYTNKNYKRYKS